MVHKIRVFFKNFSVVGHFSKGPRLLQVIVALCERGKQKLMVTMPFRLAKNTFQNIFGDVFLQLFRNLYIFRHNLLSLINCLLKV